MGIFHSYVMSSEDAQTDTKSIYTILYIYIEIHVHAYIYIYIYPHIYNYIFAVYINIFSYIHMYVDCMDVFDYTRICGFMWIYIYIYIYVCVCGRCADPDVSHVNTGDGAH